MSDPDDGRSAPWIRAARWAPAIAIMVVIFGLSSVSGLRVSDDAGVDGPLRSAAHVAAYAALAAALVFALGGVAKPSAGVAMAALAVAVLYGVSDELHQALVPGRTGQLDDLALDALGAAVGAVVFVSLLRRR